MKHWAVVKELVVW